MINKPNLAQHFLKSKKALNAIIQSAELTKNDIVLEIGPGEGILTEELLKFAGRVVAVEKDSELVHHLEKKFSTEIETGALSLVEGDIRHFDISKHQLHSGKYKLIANIPYYITGELLRTFLEGATKPSRLVFLIQKEVAERIARSKKESILSLSIKAYGTPRYIQTVPKGAFSPPPTVDSAVLLIENISQKTLQNIDDKYFFSIIKKGFSQKRKMLKGNLKGLIEQETLEQIFLKLNIPQNVRAEDLPLKTWINLAQHLHSSK